MGSRPTQGRSATHIVCVQASVARAFLRSYGRGFAAFGGPDWSALYGPEGERQFDDLLRMSTEQTLNILRQTNQSLFELQQATNQLIVRQTEQLTGQIR